TLALRLNFQNKNDQILLGAVGVNIQSAAEACGVGKPPAEVCKLREAQQDECETRAPIHWEGNSYNWFLTMFGTNLEDPEAFAKFLQSLQ
ncbi:hypothetical protein Q8G40_28865, partial [Klebsiella pneumoniae]|uniref:hypothetical protein n=1 Tax=Klebsiella pneumoniae TaxID=573 RepID=UPI003013B619